MSSAPPPENPDLLARAHVVPFVVFMAFMIFLLVVGTFIEWKHPEAPWWRQDPAQWIYPIQSIVTLGFLYHYRNAFRFDWSLKWSAVAIGFGAVGIGFWLLPSVLFDLLGYQENPGGLLEKLGVKQRDDGFNPGIFQSSAAYWTSLILRFFRAVVIVALVEEIFWRGFLMRFVMDWEGDYWKQPFGRAHWRSYLVVTGMFMLAHAPVDYAGAWIYGSLTYLLCVWSKSLGACVVMHAVANFIMGCYAMAYGKYGLW